MSRVQVYTSPSCGYCVAAKSFLSSRDIAYEVIDISGDRQLALEMVQRSGRTSVPQIFIDDQHIGGFDDLRRFDREGALMPLLANREGSSG